MLFTAAVLLIVPLGLTTAAPCEGVVDRNTQCGSLAAEPAPTPADPLPPPRVEMDVARVRNEMAFLSMGIAVAGAAVLGISYTQTAATVEAQLALDATRAASIGIFVGAGLVAGSAMVLTLFDPRSGDLLVPLFPQGESG